MSYSSVVLADSPTSYWRLADTTTSIVDAQGANNLTASGTYTQSEASLLFTDTNHSTLFNGGYAAGGGVYNPAACSWECWVKPITVLGTATYARLMGFCEGDAGTHDDFEIAIGDGSFIQLYCNAGDFIQVSSPVETIVAGTTYHVVATVDNASSEMLLYVNGNQVAATSGQHDTTYTTPNLLIAGTSSVYTNTIDAVIDEVAFYQTALTATQIANHYDAGLSTGVGSGVWFSFLEPPVQPSTSGIWTVAADPTGPPVPTGGWDAMVVEGFGAGDPALGATNAIFGPNVDDRTDPRPGFDTINDVVQYSQSQSALVPSQGAVITATNGGNYGTNEQGNTICVNSGCLTSIPATALSGTPGWPNIMGFMWTPMSGVGHTCIEAVVTLPAVNGTLGTWGMDFAFWLESPDGDDEADISEMAGILNPPPGTSCIWAMIDHTTDVNNELQSYNQTYQTDGGTHIWTTDFDCVAQTMTPYVDGIAVPGGPIDFPSPFPTTPMYVLFSFGWRHDTSGYGPTFTGSVEAQIRSFAVYQDAPNAGAGITYPTTLPWISAGSTV